MRGLSLRDPAFLGSLTLYPAYVRDYLDRVTAADVAAGNTSGLERGVTDGLSAFLQDLVAINYLGISNNVIAQAPSIIKAAPIMAGARTRQGALVPVVGTAPTSFGTESGWNYNRRTGLQGNGTDNYLDSNRNNNADPQDSQHLSVFVSTANSQLSNRGYIGCGLGDAGASQIFTEPGFARIGVRSRSATAGGSIASTGAATGLIGKSRSNSSSVSLRVSGTTSSIAIASSTPMNQNIAVFGRNLTAQADGRLSFYSIGESLDLALLDTRVTTLMNALAAAIP